MNERTILHCDVNNFFASVECISNPELKKQPVAVTGNPEKRTGIILAKNEIAKSFGIKTGMTIFEARKLCPTLVCLPPHYSKYQEISLKLHNVYLHYTDLVEPLGLDECWLDVTSSMKVLGKTGEEIAYEIKEHIKHHFGITISVGVSFSKIFAKLGSDLKKPDAVTVIKKQTFKQQTYHLPLNSIIGIGSRLEKKFRLINVQTIGQFCLLKQSFVQNLMGKTGVKLLQNLQGSEEDKVLSYYDLSQVKSIGNGTTTIKDVTKRGEIEKVIAFLAEKVSKRLIEQNFEAKTLSVSLKDKDLKRYHKSQSFLPFFASNVILRNAMAIVDSFFPYSIPIRAIRIQASNLAKTSGARQMSMFDQKDEKSAIGIEKITKKYGSDAIFRASETESYINRKSHTEQ